MEVDILVSTSLGKISSPCNLTAAIGVPSGAKIRLFRDPVRAEQSRIAVCCDKPTASRLRHRFNAPRAYTHDGQLVSLTFVGMRPVADSHPKPMPRDACKGSTAMAPQEKKGVRRGGEGGAETMSSRASLLVPPPSLPVAGAAASGGVEFALEWLELAEVDGRRVPGIAELFEEFTRTRKHCSDGEEKSRDLMEEKECDHGQPRPRHRSWWSEEEAQKDGEEQEKRGEEEKQSRLT